MEIWKPVVGYESHYECSNIGRIKRIGKIPGAIVGKILNNYKTCKGYYRASLNKDGIAKRFNVHKIIADAFIGPCPVRYQINHKDGNKSNNVPENLEYVTAKENIAHAIRNNLKISSKGIEHGSAKLTEKQVIDIRNKYYQGIIQRIIAQEYGVRRECISKIICGKRWRHI